jgi:hypothetical protein
MKHPLAKAYAGTGMLGSGFLQSSLVTAMRWEPDFIGCDAGSTDGGPSYLATGTSMFGAESTERDLAALLAAAREARIPLIIGSAGTGGGNRNLAWTRDRLLAAARKLGGNFTLATIGSELPKELVRDAWQSGRIDPLPAAPTLSIEDIDQCETIVAMMGAEPIVDALEGGADVVLCGRASDAAIYAALPISCGVSPGTAWHAAKVLECGAAAVTHRTSPDGMFAWLERESFTVAPPNADYRCTPLSVAAHSLYENADPYRLREPSGVVDLTNASYDAVDDRSVRVTGSDFLAADSYTVKLEGARLRGYRSLVMGGIRDPFVLRQLDDWLDGVRGAIATRVAASFPGVKYDLVVRRYGYDAVLGHREPVGCASHEVLVAFEVTAHDQPTAHAMADDVRHIALHFPIPQWHGLITVLAHPHSPGVIDLGPAYEFAMHHVMHLTDPLAPFTTHLETVAT